MTRQQAIAELQALRNSSDPEAAHVTADQILTLFLSSLGYDDVVEAYDAIEPKWYA